MLQIMFLIIYCGYDRVSVGFQENNIIVWFVALSLPIYEVELNVNIEIP